MPRFFRTTVAVFAALVAIATGAAFTPSPRAQDVRGGASNAGTAAPPGAVERERSVWNLQPWYIVGGAVALVVQAGLIVGLLVNRAQRRRAQRELAERLRFETLVSDLSAAFISARDVPQQY